MVHGPLIESTDTLESVAFDRPDRCIFRARPSKRHSSDSSPKFITDASKETCLKRLNMSLAVRFTILIALIALVLLPHAHAFGAGNIASISAVEGKNWRHGDIEDVLKTVACLKGHKWTSMMIKRVYFGNWLRDYSQAMDTGALKKAQPEAIRILVWILSFLSFGYATAEFEVTSDRLGVYRPEEHIDNPKDYNDNQDARVYDKRLRGPIQPIELEIDSNTGMKNYIAHPNADWATSAAFVKYSFERSIHHGRLYMNGHGLFKGKDEDLAEALRLLGQGLHCLEDFGAHTNYVELSLRELGFQDVFPHTGTNTMITLRGNRVYPLVTGTFGMVDFYHSVLGEATDHFTQSEVNEMDNALGTAQTAAQSSNPVITLVKLLSKVPGTRELCVEAEQLQRAADVQARENARALGCQQPEYGVGRGMEDYTGSRGVGDFPGSQGYGAQDHGRISQPDWSGPQVAYQGPSGGSNQQSDWNQPTPSQQSWNHSQQPSWDQLPSQAPWPHSPDAPPPSYSQTHEPGFNEQQASMGNFNFQNQPNSNFGPPSNFDSGQGQQHSQFSSQDFNQASQSFDQQQGFSQQNGQTLNQQTTVSNIHSASSNPHQAPSAVHTGLPGLPNFDPAKTIAQIYPILAFRDKVVRSISAIIEKIPGLEALVEKITETLTVFILSLLAPFVRPVITALTKTLQTGSGAIVESSGQHQYEPWTDPNCDNPTHSMLSKDHFSNVLNPPAGAVAAEILKYVAPRVLYAWQNTSVPVEQVLEDCMKVFHHPKMREERTEVHKIMFEAVRKWVNSRPDRGNSLNDILSSEGVRSGKNTKEAGDEHAGHTHNPAPSFGDMGMPGAGFGGAGGFQAQPGQHAWGGHQGSSSGGGGFDALNQLSSLPIPGLQNMTSTINKFSSLIPGGFNGSGRRGLEDEGGRSRGFESKERGIEADDSYESKEFTAPSGYEDYHDGNAAGGYGSSDYEQGSENYYGSTGGSSSNDYYRG